MQFSSSEFSFFSHALSTPIVKQTRNPDAKIAAPRTDGPLLLNLFAFTSSLSLTPIVMNRAHVSACSLNVDLSHEHLKWAKDNFLLNEVPVNNVQQTFWTKEVFKAMQSLHKTVSLRQLPLSLHFSPSFSLSFASFSIRSCLSVLQGRLFDVVILDPPTVSRFRLEGTKEM